GKLVASGDRGGSVRLWDRAVGKEVKTLADQEGGVLSLAFSPNGDTLYVCGGAGKIAAWNLARPEAPEQVPCENNPVSAAAFSPDGVTLAYFAGQKVRLCRVRSGKTLLTLDLRPDRADDRPQTLVRCWALAFSADGKLLATSESLETHSLRLILSDHTIRVWEVATGKQVLKVGGLSVPTRQVSFSPDGLVLVHGHGQPQGFGHGNEQSVFLRDLAGAEDLRQRIGPDPGKT